MKWIWNFIAFRRFSDILNNDAANMAETASFLRMVNEDTHGGVTKFIIGALVFFGICYFIGTLL